MKHSAGSEFFEKSKFENMGERDQELGKPQPPLEWEPDPGKKIIDLPAPSGLNMPDFPLRKAIEQRRSVRKYAPQPITVEELSYLLWCTQGVQQIVPAYTKGGRITQRTVPSAGARHAFETLLLVNRVDGLAPGLYRFIATQHKLVEVDGGNKLADKLAKACLEQMMIKQAAVTFFWVADAYRMTWRYRERGYRYMLLDAGHVCQNLYLCAESIGCGTCAVGAYDDNDVNRLLSLDGVERFVIYIGPVGRKVGG
ncbi:MAG: SagB/ThcOx family dehydrogenase [Candidatus Zixiibacteriota bacterium]|nr:MAG: SagB/ThcOx family dehydrogenase [candidate division Zixibacteria bacterium]